MLKENSLNINTVRTELSKTQNQPNRIVLFFYSAFSVQFKNLFIVTSQTN